MEEYISEGLQQGDRVFHIISIHWVFPHTEEWRSSIDYCGLNHNYTPITTSAYCCKAATIFTKTASSATSSHNEFLVMSIGLVNSPSVFKPLLYDVLG